MSGELIVWTVIVIGFVIGATIWWRCERYARKRKSLIMVSSIGVVLIFGKALISWVEYLQDNSTQQVLADVLVLGVLSALLGVPICDGFLVLRRKMKERSKN